MDALGDKVEYERCCVCGGLTDVPRSMPIDKRFGYVEGAGQLCERCWREIYGSYNLR